MPAKEPTLGELIDQLDKLREDYRAIEEKAKVVKAKYDDLEAVIMEKLLTEKMDKATGKRATVSLKRSLVGSIKDWDALTAYVKKTGHFHLFNRSVGAPAFRELYEQHMKSVKPGKTEEITAERRKVAEEKFVQLTGVAPFMKIAMNHSSLKASA